jgi:hypothetical protein
VQYYLIARRTGGQSDRSSLASLQFGADGAFENQSVTAEASQATLAA